jgi:hypothetical protein
MSLLSTPPRSSPTSSRFTWAIVAVAVAGFGGYALFLLLQPDAPVTEHPPASTPSTVSSEKAPEAEPAPEADVAPAPKPVPKATPAPAPPPPPPVVKPVVLRVVSDIDGADVFVNRQHVGQTPFESTDIVAGSYRVDVSTPGYDSIAEDVTIDETLTEVTAAFTVVRLNYSTAVVHKHRFGKCEGRLVANLDGVHYQSDHKDAFSVPLAQLKEFSIDYLKHTLSVKSHEGRTYDFTDDEPNADALFVFHGEVERAQERLDRGDRPAED